MEGSEKDMKSNGCEKKPGLTNGTTQEDTNPKVQSHRSTTPGVFSLNSEVKRIGPPIILQTPKYDQLDTIREAAGKGDLATLQPLFDQLRGTPAGDYWIPELHGSLADAVRNHHKDVVEYLLGQGVPLKIWIVKIATDDNNKALLEIFLQYGWDINQQYSYWEPPLLGFVLESPDMVDWFLSHGADPNARCMVDITPLSYAVDYASFDVIKTLFTHGGSIHRGQLLHFAACRELADCVEVLAYLLDKGAPINDIMYQNDLDSTNLRYPFSLGTPLHSAAAEGNLVAIKFLLERGANLNIVDSRGHTVLKCAADHKHQEVVDFLRSVLVKSPNTEPCGQDNLAYVLFQRDKQKEAQNPSQWVLVRDTSGWVMKPRSNLTDDVSMEGQKT